MSLPLVVGNAAKLYCLEAIESLAQEASELRIVDLGSGDGRNFSELLRRYPHVSYLGVDRSADACAAGQRLLARGQAEFVHAEAYTGDYGPADVVVSFSVLDKIDRRLAYMNLVARTLMPGGRAFVNYDAGHFRYPLLQDRVKNAISPLAARLRRGRWYQRFVSESEFRSLVARAGLRIDEALSFNMHSSKIVYLLVPDELRPEYMRRWLDFELAANALVTPYRDSDSRLFLTRNFVISRSDGA